MAKIKGPLYSLDARGNLARGAMQFRGGLRGVHAYRPVPPGQYQPGPSEAQLSHRALYGAAVEAWRALTPEERDAWNQTAAASARPVSGWNLFLAEQLSPQEEFSFDGGVVTEENGYRYHRFEESTQATVTGTGIVDAFLVGGGGAGGDGGGGGGYTQTFRDIQISAGQIQITVGQGGVDGPGGHSQFIDEEYKADGGLRGAASTVAEIGGNGGSGGGAAGGGVGWNLHNGANGGSDGANGSEFGVANGTFGIGQGSTTRAFEEVDGELFAGGGGGNSLEGNTPGQGGAGGGGNGAERFESAQNGADGKGGGGGGARSGLHGRGGNGVIIVRYPIPS